MILNVYAGLLRNGVPRNDGGRVIVKKISENLIDRRYCVVGELGSGAVGRVLLVDDGEQRLALKLLDKSLTEEKVKDTIERFKQEFSILKSLSHPGINRVFDFGFDDNLKQYYFTSEYVEGFSFSKITDSLPVDEVEELFIQALRALEYLHSHGIIHCDIKSGNVLVKEKNGSYEVKLIDFGLASLGSLDVVAGTPSYMAPEVILKNRPDSRADLYSLGVLVYAALTHFNPFRSSEMNETFSRQLNLVPDPPSNHNSKVGHYLDDILLRLLKKVPSERFATAAQVIRAINVSGSKSYPVETRETFLGYLPVEGALVGRAEEIRAIKKQVGAIKNGKLGEPFVLCLEGARGVGKSRLLDELKYFSQLSEFDVLELKYSDRESRDRFCKKISAIVERIDKPTIVSCHLSGSAVSGGVFVWLKRLIEVVKRSRALSGVRGFPHLMFAFAVLPEDLENSLKLLGLSRDEVRLCRLKEFSNFEVGEYLTSLTGIDDLPEALTGKVVDLTGGNPFFITEVLKSIIEKGLLFDKLGRWNKEALEDIGLHLESFKTPESLVELLDHEYLDLTDSERRFLEVLSVWNRPISLTEVQASSDIDDPLEVASLLVRKGILYFDFSESKYSFVNPLLLERVYSNIPNDEKWAQHEIIAQYLSGIGERVEILWHGSRSKNLQTSVDKVIELADDYLERSDGYGCVSLLEYMLDRLGDQKYRVTDLMVRLGEGFVLVNKYREAIAIYKRAAERLRREGSKDVDLLVDIYRRLAVVYIKAEKLDDAQNAIGETFELLDSCSDKAVLPLVISNLIARISFLKGKYDAAIKIYSNTKEKWSSLSADKKKKALNNDLAHAYLQRGDLDLAEAEFQRDISFFEDEDISKELKRSYYSMGQLKRMKGDFESAASYLGKSIALAKELSDPELLLRAYNDMGNLYNMKGKNAESFYWYERALDLSTRTMEDATASAIAVNLGVIKSLDGDLDLAVNYFQSAINIFDHVSKKTPIDIGYIVRAHFELADIFRQMKKFGQAGQHIVVARRLIHSSDGLDDNLFWVKKVEAEIAREQGEWKSAKNIIDELGEYADTDDKKREYDLLRSSVKGVRDEKTISGEIEALSIFDVPPKNEKVEREADMSEKHYRYLLEINKYLSGEKDLNFILKTIIKYAMELSGAEAGLILLEDDEGELKIRSSCNVEIDSNLSEVSVNIARSALDKDKVIVTADAKVDDRFRASKSVVLLGLKSVFCIPIHVNKKPVGVIYLENRSMPSAFADVDQNLFTAFADQAGIAIQNACLFGELGAAEEKLKRELSETSVQLEKLSDEVKRQRSHLKNHFKFDKLISDNKKMKDVFDLLEKISGTNLSVLVVGESGTGKEIISQAIHYSSTRDKGPFVAVNCGSIPANLIESEFFGYKAGAFTGAVKDKVGLFEAADGGTLFLDEIAELEVSLQSKLLRVIQEREVTRVGDTKPKKFDVRLICATNKDLQALIREGGFREDLYYRIAEIKIEIPPLRDRKEDIVLLIDRFVADYCEEHNIKKVPQVESAFIRACMTYGWPGNIRELENAVRVAAALADRGRLVLSTLPEGHVLRQFSSGSRPQDIEMVSSGGQDYPLIDGINRYLPSKGWNDYEAEIISAVYKDNGFDVKKTSDQLKIAVTTVYKKINEMGLKDKSNPLFTSPFKYQKGTTLEDYRDKIFKAAWKAASKHPYKAIKHLGVSQGHFYKVMKRF